MPAPRSTIWPLEPHTKAKHEILKRYLQAWMPILSRGNFPEFMYVDGFAGPGRYTDGEDGSPIIALDAAQGFTPALRAKIHFLFIEKAVNRGEFLESLITKRKLPSNFNVIVEKGITFEEAFHKHYDKFKRPTGKLIPTFAFIDPFGWTGAPMSVVSRIMHNPNCEVMFNFMYGDIGRFITLPDQSDNFDTLFGTDEWKNCAAATSPEGRKKCLRELYARQLESVAMHVRSFEMVNKKNQTDYYLFYATNKLIGLEKMKDAMWSVDERGDFVYSDLTDPNQFVLFGQDPNFQQLRKNILDKFSEKETSVGEIEKFVIGKTAFKKSHYKRVLAQLEKEGVLEPINPPPARRKGKFPDPKMTLRFKVQ